MRAPAGKFRTKPLHAAADSVFSWAIVIYLYTTGPFALFDLLGIRRIIQIIAALLLLVLGFKYFAKGLLNGEKNGQVALLALLGCIFLLKSRPILHALDLISACYIIIAIKGLPYQVFANLISKVVKVAALFAAGGVMLFLILAAFPSASSYIEWSADIYLSRDFALTNPLMLLGSATNESFEFLGLFSVPRIKSFLYEPSLIPMYFVVPMAMSLYIGRSRLALACIVTFCFVSLSGTFYATIGCGIISLLLLRHFCGFFRWAPLFFWIMFAAFLRLYIAPLVVSELQSEEEKVTASAIVQDFNEETYRGSRSASAAIRLASASWGLEQALNEPITGASKVHSFVFGMFIYSFVNGGIVTLMLCVVFSMYLFERISVVGADMRRNLRGEIACALIGGLYLQGFVFNDYGISSFYGMVTAAIAFRFLGELQRNISGTKSETDRRSLGRSRSDFLPKQKRASAP
jgi:hypothetical protein